LKALRTVLGKTTEDEAMLRDLWEDEKSTVLDILQGRV
jgi:hypothetical protein